MSDISDQMFEEALKLHRQQIDQADATLLQTLKARYEATDAIGRLKRQHGMPVYDEAREGELYARLSGAANAAGLPDTLVTELWHTIIDYSRKRQDETSS